MFMLLRKKTEAVQRRNHFDSLYKDLQDRARTDESHKRLKYYKDMREVYSKKSREITLIIYRKIFS
jgi:hypothetical protein